MAELTGIVLAGGRSRRMGQDKASLMLDGVSLLQRCVDRLASVVDELVLVGAPGCSLPPVVSDLPMLTVEDPVEGEGPLMGIAVGLEAASAPVAVVVAVDMPLLEPELLRLLTRRVNSTHRWVVPIALDRPQPLCSAFSVEALGVIRAHLEAGDRAPMALEADLDAYRMQVEEWSTVDAEGRSFLNVNTPEEFQELVE
ncbi:MAG: molybdopterin-guanine dinucleotide biosynthesis protein A [Chloroflexi bacterium]|jgi:molybdopterin-guanine dinucleotide biosynthesis protein A|nr:MAG: molybdopterin-guanine dinucleotide biosynthesis protein A [Chloroflexota bacterium]